MTAFSDSIQDRIDQSLLAGFNYLAQSIYCFFMGICVFQFSRLLATCRILSSKSSKLFCLVILTNPYVVRYSTGIYPEYYALLGCLLIASRLLLLNCFKLRLNALLGKRISGIYCRGKYHLIDSLFWRLILLKEVPFLLILIVISLFRYSFVAIAISYLFVAHPPEIKTFFDNIAILLLRFTKLFLSFLSLPALFYRGSASSVFLSSTLRRISLAAIFFLVLIFLALIFSWIFIEDTPGGYSFCKSIQAVVLLFGFREAFWSSSCFLNFDPTTFALTLSGSGISDSSFTNFFLSAVFGLLNSLITVIGLIGVGLIESRPVRQFTWLSLISIFFLAFILGIGHYRYLMPLLPLLYLGLFAFIRCTYERRKSLSSLD